MGRVLMNNFATISLIAFGFIMVHTIGFPFTVTFGFVSIGNGRVFVQLGQKILPVDFMNLFSNLDLT